MTGRWTVRDLRASDRMGWHVMWAAYLDAYGESVPADVTDRVFARLAEPEDNHMFGLVALAPDGEMVGIANVVIHPNTWSDQLDAYLEDLATDPAHRGQGVGHALIAALVERGREQGWRRVHWLTARDNHAARRLYDDVAEVTGEVRYVRQVS